MPRRSTTELIDEARHAATRRRLILDGATETTADAWIAAWQTKAARDGLSRDATYWTAAGRRLGTGSPISAESDVYLAEGHAPSRPHGERP